VWSTESSAVTAGSLPVTSLTPNPFGFLIEQNLPLYVRAPARDADGNPFGDFMVLIPGLRDRSASDFLDAVARLQSVISTSQEIVFVDLNVRLNLLWVSVRPQPGVVLRLFGAVRNLIPEAKLVGQRWD